MAGDKLSRVIHSAHNISVLCFIGTLLLTGIVFKSYAQGIPVDREDHREIIETIKERYNLDFRRAEIMLIRSFTKIKDLRMVCVTGSSSVMGCATQSFAAIFLLDKFKDDCDLVAHEYLHHMIYEHGAKKLGFDHHSKLFYAEVRDICKAAKRRSK